MSTERRQGRTRLVYDKVRRTIVPVSTEPSTDRELSVGQVEEIWKENKQVVDANIKHSIEKGVFAEARPIHRLTMNLCVGYAKEMSLHPFMDDAPEWGELYRRLKDATT